MYNHEIEWAIRYIKSNSLIWSIGKTCEIIKLKKDEIFRKGNLKKFNFIHRKISPKVTDIIWFCWQNSNRFALNFIHRKNSPKVLDIFKFCWQNNNRFALLYTEIAKQKSLIG